MPQTCSVCVAESRAEIDEALVGGVSYRDIAARYGVSPSSLTRHRRGHLSPALKQVVVERTEAGARSALERFEQLYDEAQSILVALKQEGNSTKALQAVTVLSGVLERIAKVTGELDDRPQLAVVNIQASEDWIALRQTIMAALAPHPQARADVARALSSVHVPKALP